MGTTEQKPQTQTADKMEEEEEKGKLWVCGWGESVVDEMDQMVTVISWSFLV